MEFHAEGCEDHLVARYERVLVIRKFRKSIECTKFEHDENYFMKIQVYPIFLLQF